MSKNQPARFHKRLTILALLTIAAMVAPSPDLVQSAFAGAAPRHSRRSYGVPTRANPTKDDIPDNDDSVVRTIAVNALGNANGSVLAIDPSTGRILAAVNQKMVFSSGFEPCSTIKPVIALAGLQEGIITRDTMINVGHRRYMDLTEAMAHSNNEYFQAVGERLGFERVSRYAKLLGLGEVAGLNIEGEQPGSLPSAPPAYGGIARMSSFGSGIRMTPLQLGSLVSTLANGGTMYYLQYPRTADARQNFAPQIKRKLDIGPLIPDLQEGMLAAVLYGTGKSSYDPYGEQALGKTGTCNDEGLGGRLGWFVSFADQAHPKIVIVVLLRGGSRVVSGPHAADVAGRIYRELRDRNYFVGTHRFESSTYATASAAVSSDSVQARQ
jgi:cell division protein FtsI/penicillin-binding protein 2